MLSFFRHESVFDDDADIGVAAHEFIDPPAPMAAERAGFHGRGETDEGVVASSRRRPMTDDEADVYEAQNSRNFTALDEFRDAFSCSPSTGHRLVDACIRVGYDSKKHGFFEGWLFSYLGKWIIEHEPEIDSDPFPHLDDKYPHDYSMTKNWVAPEENTDP